ncbi:MAG: hypothetical protein LKF70_11155 [Prevotella sp.]|jgi:hypothetical protein|nr:hypothetical protein [Prevotella sp.]
MKEIFGKHQIKISLNFSSHILHQLYDYLDKSEEWFEMDVRKTYPRKDNLWHCDIKCLEEGKVEERLKEIITTNNIQDV